MGKIPKFKSDQEAAQFWDTHSLAEFNDNLELVKENVFVKPEKQVMTIRVDKKLANAMKAIAREKGINYSTLARMWLIERVKKEMEVIKRK
ncbi:MAG: CopG family antitoxin [Thermodesulfobacteriota bacterium]